MQANLYGKYFNQSYRHLTNNTAKVDNNNDGQKRIEDIGEEDIAIINNLMMKIEEKGYNMINYWNIELPNQSGLAAKQAVDQNISQEK